MDSLTDHQLLQDYAAQRSEPAFSELVRRHVDLVYSAALRMVRDAQLAEDVTQRVFVALAQNAQQITGRILLSGWLHRTAQNLAANVVRSNIRRQAREQELIAMTESLSTEPDADWERIEPLLDDALAELSDSDRDAIFLRYFERKSANEMARTLGISDEAAQKRVNRAVDRLRDLFSKRNVAIGASGFAVLISANAVQSAPLGLATTVSSAALLAGAVAQTSTLITATKIITMTILQKTIVTVVVVTAVGVGIFEARQAAQLHDKNRLLGDQIQQLQTENENLTNRLAKIVDGKKLSEAQFGELLKLRGQTGQARTALEELAKIKSNTAQNTAMPSFLTNAMVQGITTAEKIRKKEALAKLGRMKDKINLTDDQTQAISAIMDHTIEKKSQMALNALTGKTPALDPSDANSDESAIQALLTPDQLAAYSDFKQEEKTNAATASTQAELRLMKENMDLSQEQQDKIQAALYQVNLNLPIAAQNQAAIDQARASGNFLDIVYAQIDTQKQNLDTKLKALDGILTPEQLAIYQKNQMEKIDTQANAMKMFLPQTARGNPQ